MRASERTGSAVEGLRLAFLDSWFTDPGRGSGSAVAIHGLEDAVRALGHDVERIAPRRGSPGTLGTRVAFNLGLRWRLDPDAFDVIVGFDLDGCFLPRSGTARRVTSLKGVAADEARFESGRARAELTLLAALEGRAARRAGRIVVTSEYCRERAAAAYGLPRSRFRLVPEGIDLDAWREGLRRARSEPRGGPDERPPTVLTVARQYPRKDTRSLLEAMPAVRAALPRARLRVVGGGPELPALRRRAADLGLDESVTFLGEVARREQVLREYAGADVFCLPSLQEGFGIVFLEAMATGLPIVACRAGAVPEVVPDGEVGLLVPPSDPPSLAEALLGVLRAPDLAQRLATAGRKRVERYDWRRVAERFVSAVAGGVGDTGPGRDGAA